MKKTFYKLVLKGCTEEAKPILSEIAGVDEVLIDGKQSNADETAFEIHYSQDNDVRESIYKIIQSKGWALLELSSSSTTLEQFFSELVGYGANNLKSPVDSIGKVEKNQ